jgi:hypothetical protein
MKGFPPFLGICAEYTMIKRTAPERISGSELIKILHTLVYIIKFLAWRPGMTLCCAHFSSSSGTSE